MFVTNIMGIENISDLIFSDIYKNLRFIFSLAFQCSIALSKKLLSSI